MMGNNNFPNEAPKGQLLVAADGTKVIYLEIFLYIKCAFIINI